MRHFPSCALALALLSLGAGQAVSQEETKPFSRRNPIVEAVHKTKPAIVQVRVPRANGAKDMIGSGVIVGEDGYIVTNNHMVGSADKVIVRLADGSESWAKVLIGESRYDLAILKIKASKKLAFLKPGAVTDLMVGETVIAVGNPFGYTNTVSQGIISAVDREITMPTGDTIPGLIQTDASINPGNSGGPLLNINGEFIGVNVALRQDAHGIAFAINAAMVDRFLCSHLSAGKKAGVYHGMNFSQKAVTETGADRQRVVVSKVAADGGVEAGDEILAVAARPVTTGFDVERALWDKRPGEQVLLKVVREGRELTVTLTLAASPGAGTTAAQRPASPAQPGDVVRPGSVTAGSAR